MQKIPFKRAMWGILIITSVLVNSLSTNTLYGPQRVYDTQTIIHPQPLLVIKPYDSPKVTIDTITLDETDREIELINQGYEL